MARSRPAASYVSSSSAFAAASCQPVRVPGGFCSSTSRSAVSASVIQAPPCGVNRSARPSGRNATAAVRIRLMRRSKESRQRAPKRSPETSKLLKESASSNPARPRYTDCCSNLFPVAGLQGLPTDDVPRALESVHEPLFFARARFATQLLLFSACSNPGLQTQFPSSVTFELAGQPPMRQATPLRATVPLNSCHKQLTASPMFEKPGGGWQPQWILGAVTPRNGRPCFALTGQAGFVPSCIRHASSALPRTQGSTTKPGTY